MDNTVSVEQARGCLGLCGLAEWGSLPHPAPLGEKQQAKRHLWKLGLEQFGPEQKTVSRVSINTHTLCHGVWLLCMCGCVSQ